MSAKLTGSVGRRGMNAPADVMLIQKLLAQHMGWLIPMRPPAASGQFDPDTQRCIEEFQVSAAAFARADGVVSPTGYTFRALSRPTIPEPKHPIFDPKNWFNDGVRLTKEDFQAAAKELGCEAEIIEAVSKAETEVTSPWDSSNRPTILFERHYFSRLSGRRFDRSHPDISNPAWGGHGKFSAQYPKLRRAAILDEQAALKSASWGGFQIMGANHVAAGFATVDAFVSAMMRSEKEQLDAFLRFTKADKRLLKAIRDKNWTSFARIYNGPKYADNKYDTRMAAWYAKLKPAPSPPGKTAK
jgi:hypothetical protein